MKKVLFFSSFALGITTVLAQLAVIFEGFSKFGQNELVIGLILGFWLFWVSLGSLFLVLIFKNRDAVKSLIFLHILVPFLFLVEVVLIRLGLNLSSDFLINIFYIFLITAPLGLTLGLQFYFITKSLGLIGSNRPNDFFRIFKWLKKVFFGKEGINLTYIVSRGYFFEIFGLVIGGLLYFLIFRNYSVLFIFYFSILINLAVIIFLVGSKKSRIVISILIVSVIFIWFIPDFTNNFERFTNTNNIDIKDFEVSKEIVHLPLLFHKQPKEVFIFSNNPLVVDEILEYPVENIYYANNYGIKVKSNYKVNLITKDTINYLEKSNQSFDAIIIYLDHSSTLLANRFYTESFFNLAKSRLKPDGLFAISYFDVDSILISRSIYRNLQENFKSVLVLPIQRDFLFISSLVDLNYNPWPLFERFNKQKIENKIITKSYIDDLLTGEETTKLIKQLKQEGEYLNNNKFKPEFFWNYNLSLIFKSHPKITNFLRYISRLFSFSRLIIFGVLLFFVVFYSLDVLIKKKERILANLTIFPEFCLLSFEIIFIFLFQIIYGQLYYQLSLILVAVFAGIGFGVMLGNFWVLRKKAKYAYLIRIYFFISLFFVLLALTLAHFPEILAIKIVFFFLIFLAGFLVGIEFPITTQFYLQYKLEPIKKTTTVYAADLFGSAFGVFFTTILFLPLFGFAKTLVILAIISFFGCLAMFFLRQNFEED